jgi:hypothetical protein
MKIDILTIWGGTKRAIPESTSRDAQAGMDPAEVVIGEIQRDGLISGI